MDFQVMLKDQLKLFNRKYVMVDIYPILRFSLKILQLPENRNRENGQLALKFSLISITKNRSMRYFGILGRDTLK